MDLSPTAYVSILSQKSRLDEAHLLHLMLLQYLSSAMVSDAIPVYVLSYGE